MMKKLLGVLFVALLIAAVLPVMASAEIVDSGTCGKNLTWTLDDGGTLTISGTGEMYSYAEDPGLTNQKINKLIIKEGVTSIGDDAFFDCSDLEEITIPGSVASIGHSAFSGCTNLTDLTIPEGVSIIRASAFSSCTNLKEIVIPSSVKNIGSFAFAFCTGLTKLGFNGSVSEIGGSTFQGCKDLLINSRSI